MLPRRRPVQLIQPKKIEPVEEKKEDLASEQQKLEYMVALYNMMDTRFDIIDNKLESLESLMQMIFNCVAFDHNTQQQQENDNERRIY